MLKVFFRDVCFQKLMYSFQAPQNNSGLSIKFLVFRKEPLDFIHDPAFFYFNFV